MRTVPFEPAHAEAIDAQIGQFGEWGVNSPDRYYGITFLDGDRPVGCVGGITGQRSAWALLSRGCCGKLLPITRAVKNYLDAHRPFGPVEILVRPGFEQAVRWAGILGFHYSGIDSSTGYLTYTRP